MGYFQTTTINCVHYPKEWDDVLHQIKGWNTNYSIAKQISLGIEAKALYIFTVARRITRAVLILEQRDKTWKTIFLEASLLIFPMIELIGYSRIDDRQVLSQYHKDEISNVNLWAGLHWLENPNWLPNVIDKNQKSDNTILYKWQIGHLVYLRHYLLHGSKNAKDKSGIIIPIQDIISFEFPMLVVEHIQKEMLAYWNELIQDDGTKEWISRLSRADIRPLQIQGSGYFEKGLVDIDIVEVLDGRNNILNNP